MSPSFLFDRRCPIPEGEQALCVPHLGDAFALAGRLQGCVPPSTGPWAQSMPIFENTRPRL